MTVYADAASGDAAPLRTIAGAATQLLSAWFVAVDSVNGELYVADFIGQAVRVYPLHADGDVAPIRSLVNGVNSNINQPRAVAIDTASNQIYVLSSNDSIRVFPRTASGDVAPARVIAGGNTLLDNPVGLVLDVVHDELITTSYNVGGAGVPGVLVFGNASTADGNVAPTRSIAGGNTQMGTFTNYVTFDPVNDELFVQGNEGAGVLVFPRTANGDVAPTRNITGLVTQISNVVGLLVNTTSDELLVTDINTHSLLTFDRTADGNVAPVRVVSGAATGLSTPLGVAWAPPQAVGAPVLNGGWLAMLVLMLSGMALVSVRGTGWRSR